MPSTAAAAAPPVSAVAGTPTAAALIPLAVAAVTRLAAGVVDIPMEAVVTSAAAAITAESASGVNRLCNRARLYRLRKNFTGGTVLKGHGFIRAAKSLRINAALAAEGWFSSLFAIHSEFFRSLSCR
jgi:hypothetical protein